MSISIIFFCLGFVIGAVYSPNLRKLINLEQSKQMKAIQERFKCEKNDFYYFKEDFEDSYIVSVKNKEYRVKFSISNPVKIVYCEEVCLLESE